MNKSIVGWKWFERLCAIGIALGMCVIGSGLLCAEQVGGVRRALQGSVEVDGYRIEFMGIGELDGSEGQVRLRPEFAKGLFGANGGFGANAGVGANGGVGAMPNQGIALKVTPMGGGKKKRGELLFEAGGVYEIVEFNGSVSGSKDMGPVLRSWPSFEKEFPGSTALYVHRSKGIDVDFRELSGELRVTPGRRLVVEFPVKIKKGAGRKFAVQKKRVDGEEFVLESIEEDGDGILVTVGFPVSKKLERVNDPVAMMEILSRVVNELQIEDSAGEVMVPSSSSSGGGSSSSSSGGFSGGSAGGFSFSGTTTNGFSFQSNFQASGGGGMEGMGGKLTYRFASLSEGREIKLVRAIKVERLGETEVVAFKIEPK